MVKIPNSTVKSAAYHMGLINGGTIDINGIKKLLSEITLAGARSKPDTEEATPQMLNMAQVLYRQAFKARAVKEARKLNKD